jgi:predicted nucleotidyltransferase
VRLAWALAHEAAGILRSEYGAGRVTQFGSLTEEGGRFFHEHSDIDLAASELTIATHLSALGHLLRLSPGFEFDLLDLDRCSIGLRDAIEGQGVDL